MKHLSILVPAGQSNLSTIACIAGACEIFDRANDYWKRANRNEVFEIELVGTSKRAEVHNGLVTVKVQKHISAVKKSNLIIIPSTTTRSYDQLVGDNPGNAELIDWTRKQYRKGAEIASLCTGAFILAATGLLDGRNCSTHWRMADEFSAAFPNVILKAEKSITDENGIYTNGGGYSFLNLMIYLVEKYYDRPTAIFCSKVFQIEMDRQSQSPFTIFVGQKMHGDEVVKKAQAYIENHVSERLSVEALSSRFSVSRRNFDRRFISATGNTPLEYVQRVRIESAKKFFETTRKSVNEVMYGVGYSDVKAFREVFRKIAGISPLEYKSRYNKEALTADMQ